jgi:hypothetical protein
MLARLMVTGHAAYVAFVVFGGLLVLRWPGLIWAHLAAVAWAFLTLVFDLGCPVTPWEKAFWKRGAVEPYPEGFLQHHILRTRFAAEHSRRNHTIIGVLVLVINLVVYSIVLLRR